MVPSLGRYLIVSGVVLVVVGLLVTASGHIPWLGHLPGEAEDQAEVASLSETVTVPYGTFTNCIMTKEHTALAPGDIENKYYCPHIGLMRSHDIGTIDTGKSEDLTSVNGKTMP